MLVLWLGAGSVRTLVACQCVVGSALAELWIVSKKRIWCRVYTDRNFIQVLWADGFRADAFSLLRLLDLPLELYSLLWYVLVEVCKKFWIKRLQANDARLCVGKTDC